MRTRSPALTESNDEVAKVCELFYETFTTAWVSALGESFVDLANCR